MLFKLNVLSGFSLLLMIQLTACSTPMTSAPISEPATRQGRSNNIETPTVSVNKKTPPTIVLTPINQTTAISKGVHKAKQDSNHSNNYTVRQGDTLYSIALDHGVSYRDLAQWNNIIDPNYIQIDQVLYFNPPVGFTPINGVNSTIATAIPVPVISTQQANTITTSSPKINNNINNNVNNTNITKTTPTLTTPTAELTWQMPSTGKIVATYSEGKNKGIDITGVQGDSIVAAADGKVVYAGSALKGYGKMLIVKHNEMYLSAYAHNSKLLVKEDSIVKRGQKIAEMGSTDTDNGQIKLHFEIRKYGKPIDPRKLLPVIK